MKLYFNSRFIEKLFNSEKKLIKKFGLENAKKIQQRLFELKAVDNLEMVHRLLPARCHPLKGRRKGQFAVDLKHPLRLVFKPYHEPLPLKSDGGVDLSLITKIIILEVVDYHG